MPKLGMYSKETVLARIDQRTREARLMRQIRRSLIEHVGGAPSSVQRALIERACVLSLRVAQIDAKIIAGEPLTMHDSNFALAWNNALRRTLIALGVDDTNAAAATADPMRQIADHFAARRGAGERAA